MVDLTKYGAKVAEEGTDANLTSSLASGASSAIAKFASGVVREDYQNPMAPDVIEAQKEEDKKDYFSLHAALPDAYDDEESFGSGVADFFSIADIKRSKSVTDKVAKFKSHFPNSQIRMENINGKNYLLARNNEYEKWKKIESFSTSFAADAANFATAGGIAGEVGGQAAGTVLGGPVGGIVGGGAGAFAGYIGGTVLDKGLEKLRGYSKEESLAPNATDYLTGAAGGAISFIGRPVEAVLGRTSRFLKGTTETGQTEAAKKAISFAEKEGLKPPTVGQVSTGITGSVYSQATNVDESTFKTHIEAAIALRERLLKQAEEMGYQGVDRKVLQEILDKDRTEINELIRMATAREIELDTFSSTMRTLSENWREATKAHFNTRYKGFNDTYGDDLSFNFVGVQSKAREYINGILQKGRDVEKEVGTGLLDKSGKEITKTVLEEGGPVQTNLKPSGELGDLLDRLLKLDPHINKYTSPGGKTFTALESVKQLRSDFWKLRQSQDPQTRHIANEMHKALNKSFDNAIVNIGDPALNAKAVEEWKKLSSDYRAFMELEDITPIARLREMDDTQIADWGKTLFKPGSYQKVKLLGDILGPDGQQAMKDMFFTTVTSGNATSTWKNKVNETLDSFVSPYKDTMTRDYLMTPKDQELLRRWAAMRDDLESGAVSSLVAKDLSNAERAIQLANLGDTDKLRDIIRLAGGEKSKTFESIQAGFLQHLVNGSTRYITNVGHVLNGKELAANISRFRDEKDTLGILFPGERWKQYFDGLIHYSNTIGIKGDMGSSLQVAEMGSTTAKGAAKGLEQAVTGQGGKAAETAYKLGTMTLPYKYIGRFLVRDAKVQDVKPAGKAKGAFAKGADILRNGVGGVKKATQFGVYMLGQEKNDDLQQWDAETWNKQYDAGGM